MNSPSVPVPQSQRVRDCMHVVLRIASALENYAHAVETRFGLTGPQLEALWDLGRAHPLALKDLAARRRLDPSTVVGVVDRLVTKGLVIRERDARDRRRISICPTAKGSALLQMAPPPPEGHLLAKLDGMQPSDVERLHQALRSIAALLETTLITQTKRMKAKS